MALARNKGKYRVEHAWILRGIREGFAWILIVRESEWYKDYAVSTVLYSMIFCPVRVRINTESTCIS